MGRLSLIITYSILSTLQVSAQSGGYSYLEFVENKGQWDSSILYRAELSAGDVFIQKKGFMILQQDTNDLKRIHDLLHGEYMMKGGKESFTSIGKGEKGGPGSGYASDPFLLHSHVYQVSFENANEDVAIVPDKPFVHHNNYFGKGKKGAVNCRVFQGVIYKNLYDGIDLHYYTEGGFVKYDLIVHPGADPGKIILKYDGQQNLSLKKNQIYVRTSVGTVRELEPKSYQVNGQGRADVSCKYRMLDGNRIQFKVENYSKDATLVIDPTEIFCSFTGSHSDNWGYTATYDNSGNFYLGGIVLQYPGDGGSGSMYGATKGAFQSTFQGGDGTEGHVINQEGTIIYYYNYDIGIMKFNPIGTVRLWATYLGGPGDEQPHSMVCDAQGDLIVTGRTSSVVFPPDTLPKYGPCGGLDLFVAKLSPDGSTLQGVMRIGGTGDDGVNNSPKYLNQFGHGTQELRLNYGDDGRSEVILDGAGNIYVAACMRPGAGGPDFPTTAFSFQPAFWRGRSGWRIAETDSLMSRMYFSAVILAAAVRMPPLCWR